MALTGAFITEHGIELTNAYLNISNVHVTKENIDFSYHVYKDETSYIQRKRPIIIGHGQLSIDHSVSTFTQIYNHLKTLPEFNGWVNC